MGKMLLAFDIYLVDEEATKNAVEKYLLQAREYKVTEYIPLEQKIIAGFEPRYGSPYDVSKPVERIAIQNVDEPERRRRHVERTEKAIARLGSRQQTIIRKRYMDDDNVMDFTVAQEIGYSDRQYRRYKSVALFRLAGILGLVKLRE